MLFLHCANEFHDSLWFNSIYTFIQNLQARLRTLLVQENPVVELNDSFSWEHSNATVVKPIAANGALNDWLIATVWCVPNASLLEKVM
jgi:hypothetical protein